MKELAKKYLEIILTMPFSTLVIFFLIFIIRNNDAGFYADIIFASLMSSLFALYKLIYWEQLR